MHRFGKRSFHICNEKLCQSVSTITGNTGIGRGGNKGHNWFGRAECQERGTCMGICSSLDQLRWREEEEAYSCLDGPDKARVDGHAIFLRTCKENLLDYINS